MPWGLQRTGFDLVAVCDEIHNDGKRCRRSADTGAMRSGTWEHPDGSWSANRQFVSYAGRTVGTAEATEVKGRHLVPAEPALDGREQTHPSMRPPLGRSWVPKWETTKGSGGAYLDNVAIPVVHVQVVERRAHSYTVETSSGVRIAP
jgi:hypothetical protein